MWITRNASAVKMGDALREIEGISDRACAIVTSALVEDHLTNVLRASFHQDEVILREMFSGIGPLASFSSKIKMGFMIGIFSKSAYRNLQVLRKIRNMFAHEADSVSFDTPPIRDLALNLDLHTFYNIDVKRRHPLTDALHNLTLLDDIKPKLDTPKYRYIATCRLFLAHFTVIPPTEPPNPLV